MPKKGDDLTATATNLQASNDSVLSAIKEKQGKPKVPSLVPVAGSRTKDEKPTEPTAEEVENQRKKKEAERLRQAKLKEQAAVEARAQEIENSPWIACRPKVRKARVDMLDKIYNLRKVGDYEGTKQDFYDEGLELLEEKYADIAKEVVRKQSA